jgi:hypothetical protein
MTIADHIQSMSNAKAQISNECQSPNAQIKGSKLRTEQAPPLNAISKLSDNLKLPSPLMGEGKGGGVNDANIPHIAHFPLPFIPSRQGRGKQVSDSLFRGIWILTFVILW